MPLLPEQKRWALQQAGYDPNQYDLDDDGYAFQKSTIAASPNVQPAALSTDMPQPKVGPQPMDAASTFAKEAIHAAPAAAAGGIGAALGAAGAGALAGSIVPGIGTLGGAIVGGLGALAGGAAAGMGASYIQNEIEQEFAPEYTAQRLANIQAHPTAGMLGRLASLPVGGMNPSALNPIRAAGTVGTTLGKIPANGIGGAIRTMPAPEAANLLNVGIGGVIGAGIPAGQAIARGESPLNVETLEGAVGGTLFNQPNAIGRNIMGFHPVNWDRAATLDVQRQGQQLDAEMMARILAEQKANEIPVNTQPIRRGINPVSTLAAMSSTMHPIVGENAKGPLTAHIAGQPDMYPLLSAEEAAAQKSIPRESLQSPEAVSTEQDLQRSAYNDKLVRELNKKKQEADVARAKIEYEQSVQALQTAMQKSVGAKAAPLPKPIVTTEAGKEIYPDYTGIQADAETQATMDAQGAEADAIQERLERVNQPESENLSKISEWENKYEKGVVGRIGDIPIVRLGKSVFVKRGDRWYEKTLAARTPTGEPATIAWNLQNGKNIPVDYNNDLVNYLNTISDLPTEPKRLNQPESETFQTEQRKQATAALENAGVSPSATSLWNEALARFGAANRNVEAGPQTDLGSRGATWLKSGLQKLKAAWDPQSANVDTVPHELIGHAFIQHLAESPYASDRAIVNRLRTLTEKSPEYAQWKAAHGEGLTDPVGEFIASQQGLEFIMRDKAISGEGEWKSWWRDFKSQVKGIMGNATESDLRRLIDYKWNYDQPFAKYFGKEGGVAGTANARMNQPQDETLKGYRLVTVRRPDGSSYDAYFNDKYYDMGDMGKFASIAKMTEGGLTHGATKKGEVIEERFNQPDSEELTPKQKYKAEWFQKRQAENAEVRKGYTRSAGVKPTTYPDDPAQVASILNAPKRRVPLSDIVTLDSDSLPALGSRITRAVYAALRRIGATANKPIPHNAAEVQDARSTVLADLLENGVDRDGLDTTIQRRAHDAVSNAIDEFKQTGKRKTISLDAPVGKTGKTLGDYVGDEQSGQDVADEISFTDKLDAVSAGDTEVEAKTGTKAEDMPEGMSVVEDKSEPVAKKVSKKAKKAITKSVAWYKDAFTANLKREQELLDESIKTYGEHSPEAEDAQTVVDRTQKVLDVLSKMPDDATIDLSKVQRVDQPESEILSPRLQAKDAQDRLMNAGYTVRMLDSDGRYAGNNPWIYGRTIPNGMPLSVASFIPDNIKNLANKFIKAYNEYYPNTIRAKADQHFASSKVRALAFSDKSYQDLLPVLHKETQANLAEDLYHEMVRQRKHQPTIKADYNHFVGNRQHLLGVYYDAGDASPGKGFTRRVNDVETATHEALHGFFQDKHFDVIEQVAGADLTPAELSHVISILSLRDYPAQSMAVSTFANSGGKLTAASKSSWMLGNAFEELAAQIVSNSIPHSEETLNILAKVFGKDFVGYLRDMSHDKRFGQAKFNANTMTYYQPLSEHLGRAYDYIRPEVEKLRAKNPDAAEGANKFYELQRAYRGQWEQSLIREVKKIRGAKNADEYWKQDNSDYRAVVNYLYDIQDGKTPVALTSTQKRIEQAVRDNLKLTWAAKQARPEFDKGTKANPNYLPNMMSREVASVLAEDNNGAKAQQYKQDFIDYRTKVKKQSLADATSDWKTLRGQFNLTEEGNTASRFGAIDKAAGLGLPRSMREQSLLDLMSRFNRRYARRIAYYDAIQSDEKVKDAFFNDETGAASSQVGQNILQDIFGIREHAEATRSALSGIIRAAMLGPLTGAKDVVSGQVLGMQHMALDQVLPAKMEALRDWKSNYEKAIKTGVVRENVGTFEDGVGGFRNIQQILVRSRDVINQVQGRALLENVSRVLNFGEGRYLATDALMAIRRGQLTGQKRAFLDNFLPDWQKYKNTAAPQNVIDEAAAKYVESVQGTYDYRGLPEVAQKGTAAPFLALARWNIEKFNNFTKHVVTPATKGNYTPLLMATLGMFIGGAAVNKLVEEATGRKQKTPTWSEIEASKEKTELLGYKLAGLASLSGYGGIMGDIVKSAYDAKVGNRVQTFNNPLFEGVGTLVEDTKFLVEAMQSNDLPAVTDALNMLASDYIQAYRVALPHISEEKQQELDATNKRRDLKVYELGEGLPAGSVSYDRPNPLLDTTAKEFKRTGDMNRAVELLPEVIDIAIKNATIDGTVDPERLKAEFAKLKKNSYQTVPAPEENPMRFGGYVDWLGRTQGQDEANNRVADFMARRAINKAKSSMIPSF